MVAHRVVDLDGASGSLLLVTRGDAQATTEKVPRSAVAYCVSEVRYGVARYRTDSLTGRALAKIAVNVPLLLRATNRAVHATRRILRDRGQP